MASSERARHGGRAGALLVGAALSLLPAAASAQQAFPGRPLAPAPAAPPAAPAPAAPAAPASPALPAQPAAPVEEPPYDPGAHKNVKEGAWLRVTRDTARRSTGMMVTGIGFITLAASLIAAGTGVYLNDDGCHGVNNACNGGHATGMALMSSGLIALGLGLPLTIYGASEVPYLEAGSTVSRSRAPALRVTAGVTPTGASLALRF